MSWVVLYRVKPSRNIATFAPANERTRNKRTSNTGCGWCSSHQTSATAEQAQTVAKTRIVLDANPSSCSKRSSVICKQPKVSATSRKPNQSGMKCARNRRVSSRTAAGSSTSSQISVSAIRPTGRLIRKIQCHEYDSVSQPPSTGPTAGATTTVTP